MIEMERRRIATNKTMKRFRKTPFDWSKSATCVHLARFQMRTMGHKPMKVPAFRTAITAKKALADLGHDSVTSLFDTMLPRIAPAQMLLGDLISFPGEGGLDAITVCAGPHKVIGWHADHDTMVVLDIELDEIKAAWRL